MKKRSLIILFLFMILLCSSLYFLKRKDTKILPITFSTISQYFIKNDYSLVYIGEPNQSEIQNMREWKKEYQLKLYKMEMDEENIKSYLESYQLTSENNNIYLVFSKEKPLGVINRGLSFHEQQELIEKFLFNKIPESERVYKTIDKASDYIKLVNSNKYTIAVFGYEGCTYCNLYLPVINKIAKEQKVSIYYFDRDHYDEDEWKKIMNLDLPIPGECTIDGKDTSMAQSFPKPMTLITKKGKLEGCIRGYVKEEEVLAKLKEFKMIKEKK